MIYDNLSVTQDGPIDLIALNRDAKRNALNDPTIAELDHAFSNLRDDAKAVVLHGIGANFSAGLDLSELKSRDATEGMHHSRSWHRAFEKIQYGRVPVVAALHGAVIGGGLELASSAHIRVADQTAFYALPEGSRGIYVGGGGSVRIPRLIGVERMMDMMLTGRRYTAAEGYPLGFSQYLVDTGTALTKAKELAHRIAENAPMTNYAVMHVLPRIAEADPAMGFMAEAFTAALAQADQEAKRRVTDFLEKRGTKVERPT
jgi:(methylthio)acryloyl-CoA hydratase